MRICYGFSDLKLLLSVTDGLKPRDLWFLDADSVSLDALTVHHTNESEAQGRLL